MTLASQGGKMIKIAKIIKGVMMGVLVLGLRSEGECTDEKT